MAALRDIGEFIREQRRHAQISLRQLAEQAGVSNPYLSQIERGLRKPSAEVLQQIANALRVSTPIMYLRAGLLDLKEGQGVLAAIAADSGLTTRQKQTLTEIYEAFRRENARFEPAESAGATEPAAPGDPAAAEPSMSVPAPATSGHPGSSDAEPSESVSDASTGPANRRVRKVAKKAVKKAARRPAAPKGRSAPAAATATGTASAADTVAAEGSGQHDGTGSAAEHSAAPDQ
ncbi:MAG: helix-turn-helix transcriptional regulator [Actinocatenispora sp.]